MVLRFALPMGRLCPVGFFSLDKGWTQEEKRDDDAG